MKTTKRMIALTAVIALLFSMSSCMLLKKKARFTQKVTADNVELTIRDDMTDVGEVKTDLNYIAGYKCKAYGLNITKVEADKASALRLSGENEDSLLRKIAESGKNPSDVKKFGDISYIELTDDSGENELFTIVYVTQQGYEFYAFEFYTLFKNGDKYRQEYETIISSAKTVEEPPKTIDITIEGVTLTVDGDAYSQGADTYICGRYSVSIFNTNLSSSLATPEMFAQATIKSGNYKDFNGQAPVIQKTAGGTVYFEGIAQQLYATHYIKEINRKLYYIMLSTLVPTDEQLKAEFNDIVDAAYIA